MKRHATMAVWALLGFVASALASSSPAADVAAETAVGSGAEATASPRGVPIASPAPSRAPAGSVHTDVPESPDPHRFHVIYLHGRIIEHAGPRPTDPRFGLYDYPAVLDALAARGATVVSAQRAPNTDMDAYAGVVVAQVERLIERGVAPDRIVVVGFSKGGGIAVRVSSFLRRPEVRFVLLAACVDGPVPPNLRLTGHVLSVVEESDTIAGSCRPLAESVPRPQSFTELLIATGKLHGAFYRPNPEWVEPLLDWVEGRLQR